METWLERSAGVLARYALLLALRYLTARITAKAKPRTRTESATAASRLLWNSAKMASGMVWVTPLKLPAKMIVAPNSPSAQAVSAPATSAGQGYCDPEESPPVAGPIDHGSLLYRPVYRAETRRGLPDVERGGHWRSRLLPRPRS